MVLGCRNGREVCSFQIRCIYFLFFFAHQVRRIKVKGDGGWAGGCKNGLVNARRHAWWMLVINNFIQRKLALPSPIHHVVHIASAFQISTTLGQFHASVISRTVSFSEGKWSNCMYWIDFWFSAIWASGRMNWFILRPHSDNHIFAYESRELKCMRLKCRNMSSIIRNVPFVSLYRLCLHFFAIFHNRHPLFST